MNQQTRTDQTQELLRLYAVQERLVDLLADSHHLYFQEQAWHTFAANRARLLSEQKRRWPIRVKWHGIPLWRKLWRIGIDKYWQPFARWGISTPYGMVRLQRYGPITLIIGEDPELARAMDETGRQVFQIVQETRPRGRKWANEELACAISAAERES
jgi:hypothetical protein